DDPRGGTVRGNGCLPVLPPSCFPGSRFDPNDPPDRRCLCLPRPARLVYYRPAKHHVRHRREPTHPMAGRSWGQYLRGGPEPTPGEQLDVCSPVAATTALDSHRG